jgi:hypothetical protein
MSATHGPWWSAPERRTVIVTTTIRVPSFLTAVYENAARAGHRGVDTIVIGDAKTPPETRAFCARLAGDTGCRVQYLDLDDQRRALEGAPALWQLMPANHGSRKLIGNFLAYREGYETLIMLDDDNFVLENDFIGWHNAVGSDVPMDLMHTETGWYNVYEAVLEARGLPIYPRGFPWSQRSEQAPPATRRHEARRVIVKNGLVLNDPDIDAISRLFWPVRITGIRPSFEPQLGLAPGVWCPFNNQNTALAREVVPVFFTPPSTGRNADIWTSYVLCRLAEHFGSVIAFGQPLVRQDRNPHDLFQDLEDELVNNRATDAFVELLRAVPLSAATYSEALAELLRGALERLRSCPTWPAGGAEMARTFFEEYSVWHEVCQEAADVRR